MTIVGARPQFMKAAPIGRALRVQHQEVLVHTGQHYDAGMSQVFFDELRIPAPDYNLAVGSGSHAEQTAKMLVGIERLLLDHRPDWLLVIGDTNSTLAGALAASKTKQPLAHVEAGLRSHNRWNMPEEVNRVLTDHVSDLLLAPSRTAAENLRSEGITRGVEVVGDPMVDVLYENLACISSRSPLRSSPYSVLTFHRPENTDDPARLRNIVHAINQCPTPVVFPIHPRTKSAIERSGLAWNSNVEVIDPVGYLDMLTLVRDSRFVITDSGGLVREAHLMGRMSICLRRECEWTELVESGWCLLTDTECESILQAVSIAASETPETRERYYGDGNSAARIVEALEHHLHDPRTY